MHYKDKEANGRQTCLGRSTTFTVVRKLRILFLLNYEVSSKMKEKPMKVKTRKILSERLVALPPYIRVCAAVSGHDSPICANAFQ